MSEQTEQYLQAIREQAKRYAESKGNLVTLDHARHATIAQLMKEAEEKGFTTAAAQEREAKASDTYKDVVMGLGAATKLAIEAEWELKVLEWRVELWRTEQANERAERRNYAA